VWLIAKLDESSAQRNIDVSYAGLRADVCSAIDQWQDMV
jgi:hypothetical protein